MLVINLSRRWDEPLIVDSIRAFSEAGVPKIIALFDRLWTPTQLPKRGWRRRRALRSHDRDLRLFALLSAWPNLIETIGVLWDTRAITTEVVYKMWGGAIVGAWDRWERPVDHLRKLEDGDDSGGGYRFFQSLAEEMRNEEFADRTRQTQPIAGQV